MTHRAPRRTMGTWVVVLGVAGCAAMLPQRYPSAPPAGLSPAQAEQDQRDCVSLADRATSERAWEYIGCMIARGHTVGVAFQAGGPTYLHVRQTRPHDAAAVSSEVAECRVLAYAAGRAGSRDGMIDRMEAEFRRCLDPRGYVVRRQAPAPPPASGRPAR